MTACAPLKIIMWINFLSPVRFPEGAGKILFPAAGRATGDRRFFSTTTNCILTCLLWLPDIIFAVKMDDPGGRDVRNLPHFRTRTPYFL